MVGLRLRRVVVRGEADLVCWLAKDRLTVLAIHVRADWDTLNRLLLRMLHWIAALTLHGLHCTYLLKLGHLSIVVWHHHHVLVSDHLTLALETTGLLDDDNLNILTSSAL